MLTLSQRPNYDSPMPWALTSLHAVANIRPAVIHTQ